MSKKYITVGLLAGLTAGTGAGLILQQTGSAGASSSSSTSATDAQVQDDTDTTDADTTETTDTDTDTETDSDTGSVDERPDQTERLATVLAPLVADGTLTQAQADSVVETLVAAGGFRGGHGHGGRGGHHGDHGANLDTVASVLGITADELRTQLATGMSIADVAGAQTQAVIDALVAAATTRIEQGVTDGRLTRAEADERLAELNAKVTELVNRVWSADGDRTQDDTVVDDSGS